MIGGRREEIAAPGAKVLRIVGVAGIVTHPGTGSRIGQYVKSFYAEAYDGRGSLITTEDADDAMRFPDAAAAIDFYQRVPINRPTRPDGEPNRPLTAFHMAVEAAPPEEE